MYLPSVSAHFFFWQVVYAIMHRQEVFEPFKNHPRFSELIENIYMVFIICSFLYVNITVPEQIEAELWAVVFVSVYQLFSISG
jgi:hypothetical protein